MKIKSKHILSTILIIVLSIGLYYIPFVTIFMLLMLPKISRICNKFYKSYDSTKVKNVQQVIGASINDIDISSFCNKPPIFRTADNDDSICRVTFSFDNNTQILDQIEKIFEIGTGLQIVVGPQVGSNDTTEITINNFARVGVIEKDESGPIKVTIEGYCRYFVYTTIYPKERTNN